MTQRLWLEATRTRQASAEYVKGSKSMSVGFLNSPQGSSLPPGLDLGELPDRGRQPLGGL